MSIMQLLKTRRAEKAGDVTDLAKRVAAGETVDPDRILDACGAAGIDDETFLELVDLVERRQALRIRAAGLKDAERDRDQLTKRIAAEDAKLAEARKAHDAACEPIREQLAIAEGRWADAALAREQLLSPSNLPKSLADRRHKAGYAVEKAQAEHGRIAAMVARAESELRGATAAIGDGLDRVLDGYRKGCVGGVMARQCEIVIRTRSELDAYRQPFETAARELANARETLAAIDAECRNF